MCVRVCVDNLHTHARTYDFKVSEALNINKRVASDVCPFHSSRIARERKCQCRLSIANNYYNDDIGPVRVRVRVNESGIKMNRVRSAEEKLFRANNPYTDRL